MTIPENEIIVAILFTMMIIIAIGIFMWIMFLLYRQKQLGHLKEKESLKQQYDNAVLHAQSEIREQTLHFVGQELHDNIGQLLSLTKLYLSSPSTHNQADIKEIVEKAIAEVRSLSQTLNLGKAESLTLVDFIKQQIALINRSEIMEVSLKLESTYELVDKKSLLIICRVFQECLSNIIRHAEATRIGVHLYQTAQGNQLLQVEDNGIGFDLHGVAFGAGLHNMQERMRLINGDVSVHSKKNMGTKVTIVLPHQTN